MKALIIILGVALGLFLGFFPKYDKPKPGWWKVLAFLLMTASVCLSLLPPLAENPLVSKYMTSKMPEHKSSILLKVVPSSLKYDHILQNWNLQFYFPGKEKSIENMVVKSKDLPEELKSDKKMIIKLKYDVQKKEFIYLSTAYVNPLLVFPFVPGLEEQIRILNFHVPVAWIAVLAFLISMIYSFRYLKTKDFEYDLLASSAAGLGLLFSILATVTGMVWAKFNWGSFWNWDPRETSIFILLLIYGAYFSLRSAIENPETKARLSSVYSILSFITVPFLVFILPRILSGLHPGSENDSSTGPILSAKEGALSIIQQISFSLGFAAITVLFFWMLNIYIRQRKLQHKIEGDI